MNAVSNPLHASLFVSVDAPSICFDEIGPPR